MQKLIRSKSIAVFLIPLFCLAGNVLLLGVEPVVHPDSQSYLDFAPYRGAGYPFILWLAGEFLGGLQGLVMLQWTSFLLASITLGLALQKRGLAWLLPILSVIAGNPLLNEFHNNVLTESLFCSGTVLAFAIMVWPADNSTTLKSSLLGVLVGGLVILKPTAYALLPVVFLWLLTDATERLATKVNAFVIYVALVAVFVGTDALAYKWLHPGVDRESLATRHAFAKSLLIQVPQKDNADGPLHNLVLKLERDSAPIRQLLDDAPNTVVSAYLQREYEVFLQYSFASYEQQMAAQQAGVSLANLQKEIARMRIADNPFGLWQVFVRNYFASWSVYYANHPLFRDQIQNYIDSARPLPFSSSSLGVPEYIPVSRWSWLVTSAIWGAWLASIVIGGIYIWQLFRPLPLETTLRDAMLIAGYLQAYTLGIALSGIGIERYTLTVWPMLVLCGYFLLLLVLRPSRTA